MESELGRDKARGGGRGGAGSGLTPLQRAKCISGMDPCAPFHVPPH